MNILPASVARSVVGVLLGLAAIAAAPQASQAADTTTWSVQPSSNGEADGRAWIEAEVEAGDEMVEELVITNHGRADTEFRLAGGNGYFTDNGRFTMRDAGKPSTGAGTWIDIDDSVVVPAGASRAVSFSVSVPSDATPGDHLSAVAASIRTDIASQVGVESRVGFRVILRVAGELRGEVSAQVSGDFTGAFNPFQPGALTAIASVSNSGNTRAGAEPVFVVSGPFGIFSQRVPADPIIEMGPGETRSVTARAGSLWPIGFYSVDLELTPTAVGDASAAAVTVTDATMVAAVPWSQLGTLAVGMLLLLWYIVDRRRREAQHRHELARAWATRTRSLT